MLRKYHRILPAPPVTQEGQSSADSPDETRKKSKKRQLSRLRPGACTDCQAQRIKCNRTRPICGACSKRGITTCTYPDMLSDGSKAIELVDLFRSLSNDRSIALLKRLREKVTVATILAEYREDSDGSNSRSTKNKNSLESELKAHNPIPFPEFPPIDMAKSGLLHLQSPTVAPSFAYSIPPPHTNIPNRMSQNDTATPNAVSPEFTQLPKRPANYCDERLKYLQVDFWTGIPISNDFAARVISLYIKTDHPLLGVFDSHLFIIDLVSKRTDYCSRFLFHALMHLGCRMYSAFDEHATQYTSEFLQTAEALWKTERNSYSSMAGAVLLSISLMGHGEDHTILSYATDAIKIGTQLGLFGDTQHPAGVCQFGMDVFDNDLGAKCHAAWGAFNWNVMISMFYRQLSSQPPALEPTVPIPGEIDDIRRPSGVAEADLVAGMEVDREYEFEEDSPPEEVILRGVFPVLCNFWRNVQRSRWSFHVAQKSPSPYPRHTLVEYAYRELIAWAERLPSFLLRRERSPYHVTVFHIWLHTAILDMWQPFILSDENEAPQLTTFSARDRTPDAAYAASVQQLKQLIFEYRSRHVESTCSILWHNGLVSLLNVMLRCTDPDWRPYLLLCIYEHERLRRPYRISEVVTRGLLKITMKDTNLSVDDAFVILGELKERGLIDIKDELEGKIRAVFTVDPGLSTDTEAAEAEVTASDFDGMAMYQDLIDLDPN